MKKQGKKKRPNAVNTFLDTMVWGSHICQFYREAEDMLDTLIPYFTSGLQNNEFCMWVTAEPLDKEHALAAARERIPDFERYERDGQIEVLSHDEWYLKGGPFDRERVLQGWVDKVEQALARGYEGLRLTGNTFWLEKDDWDDFTEYEAVVDSVIGNYRMKAI